MYKKCSALFGIVLVIVFSALPVAGETVTTRWSSDAGMVYDTGFMHMLRKYTGSGVGLFNMDLIENDSPGAGMSEKGVYSDTVWGKNRARKILYIDDPKAEKSFLVFFFLRQGKYPLRFDVNGHQEQVDNWNHEATPLSYHWTEFPFQWLKKGKNVIDLYCPEAESGKEGWPIYIARADEFEHGGGDTKNVGKTSFKSSNGGKSWKESPFGPDGKTRAEYSVRISLDRYVKTGWLASPVIDLWKGDSKNFIVPLRRFEKMRIAIESEVPEGTKIEYYLRKGTNPGPFSEEWNPYEFIGEGESIDLELDKTIINGRFVQFKAVLSTVNPLRTPLVKSASVMAEFMESVPLHKSIMVTKTDNPVIRYSSVDWEWEKWDRPEFKELRIRENLDGVIAGSKTQFEAIVKLTEYATTRVPRLYGTPYPEYPGWDALSNLDRIDRHGNMGMCIQFNNFLYGMCMAYGWQGRLINGMHHEMAEVWSDDFGKWVYLEASYANHYLYDTQKGKPMSLLEIHNAYIDYFYPDRPIDWMNDITTTGSASRWAMKIIEERDDKPPLKRSSTTYHQNEMLAYKGFVHSTFMRMVPRNNFYEKPIPLPLRHGYGSIWPWNGYINWYDERTPPKRLHSWHTDRARDMWPDLNLIHIDATSGHSNKFLYLRFETYTPNLSHFEVDENDTGWKKIESDRWTWVLASGKNTLRVRVMNKLGAKGKPSMVEIFRADVPLKELY